MPIGEFLQSDVAEASASQQTDFAKIRQVLFGIFIEITNSPEYIDALNHQDPKTEFRLRSPGTALHEQLLPLLIAANLSQSEVVRLLHEYQVIGWKSEENGYNRAVPGGQYRREHVAVGEEVPPHFDDVEELMSVFEQRMEVLLNQAEPQDIDALAVWTYLVIQAIHPFPDGNGRTGRGYLDYVREKLRQKYALPSNSANFYPMNTGKVAIEDTISDVLTAHSLSSEVPLLFGKVNSLALYTIAKDMFLENWYFARAKKKILDHLSKISSIADFRAVVNMQDLVSKLEDVRAGRKYQTKPLLDLKSREIAERRRALQLFGAQGGIS
jgi:hypothetical protein